MPSRGFRITQSQMERIYTASGDVDANPNRLVKCLVEIGLEVWSRLTENQRRRIVDGLGVRYSDRSILRKDQRISEKLEVMQMDERLNDRLGFALPTRTKEWIRHLAKRTRTTMSEVAREKLRT